MVNFANQYFGPLTNVFVFTPTLDTIRPGTDLVARVNEVIDLLIRKSVDHRQKMKYRICFFGFSLGGNAKYKDIMMVQECRNVNLLFEMCRRVPTCFCQSIRPIVPGVGRLGPFNRQPLIFS